MRCHKRLIHLPLFKDASRLGTMKNVTPNFHAKSIKWFRRTGLNDNFWSIYDGLLKPRYDRKS